MDTLAHRIWTLAGLTGPGQFTVRSSYPMAVFNIYETIRLLP